MNKIQQLLSLSIFLLLSFQSISQQLVKPGNQWNIHYPPTFEPSFSTDLVSFLNDTIIDGLSYLKVGTKSSPSDPEFVFNNSFMREDSTKKVFLKQGSGDEFLLYDFGLELGDSITFSSYCSLMVVAIDSVQLNNGEMRKRYEFEGIDTPYTTTYWIEGIGSDLGLLTHFFNFCLFDVPAQLLCFYENEELLYPNDPPSCFLTQVNDLPDDLKVDIYPNPFEDHITIDDPDFIFKSVQIFNSVGQLLVTKTLNSSFNKISLHELEIGIYYLNLADENGNVFTKRIVSY